MFAKVDLDNTGQITLEEFRKVLIAKSAAGEMETAAYLQRSASMEGAEKAGLVEEEVVEAAEEDEAGEAV